MKELLLIEAVALLGAGVTLSAPPKAREVEVIAVDYAFQVPRELPAGPTTFRVVNKGKQRHELNIFLLKRGATVNQVLALQTAGKSTKPLVEGPVGVLFAEPGERNPAGMSTDLLPGREYAVVCILRDTADAQRHYEMGMYSVIKVQPKKPALAAVSPRRDTIVGFDHAFRYPQSLAPGNHTFVFKNEGKVRHEFSMVLLKPGVTQAQIAAVDKTGDDVDKLIEAGMGLLWSRAGEMPFGRLEVDLLPGREYEIICFFSDDAKFPSHFERGMYGNIKVTGSPRSP